MKQHNTRLMKGALTLLTIAMLTITGCKKDDEAGPNGGKTVLKYEIVSTSPFQVITGIGTNYSVNASYINATGNTQTEQSSVTGTTWSKTVEFTSTQRPIAISLIASGYTASTTGTVTANIYENGVLKANSVFNISASGIQGTGMFIIPNVYYLKQ